MSFVRDRLIMTNVASQTPMIGSFTTLVDISHAPGIYLNGVTFSQQIMGGASGGTGKYEIRMTIDGVQTLFLSNVVSMPPGQYNYLNWSTADGNKYPLIRANTTLKVECRAIFTGTAAVSTATPTHSIKYTLGI